MTQHGLLIPTDATSPKEIFPADGQKFTLEELQAAVDGYIEVYDIGDEEEFTLYLNEDGKLIDLPDNPLATAIMRRWHEGSIFNATNERVVGRVLIVGPRLYEVTEVPV